MSAPRTVAEQVAATQRLLAGYYRTELNVLGDSVDETGVTVRLAEGIEGVGRGTILGIGDELVYVWSVDRTTGNTRVKRAMFGTEAAEHLADDLIEVAPRFPRSAIRDALVLEMRSWAPKLYVVETEEVTFGATDRAATILADGLLFGLDLLWLADDARWLPVRYTVMPGTTDWSRAWQIQRSGSSLHDGTHRFRYAAVVPVPDDPDDVDDLVADYKLADSMLDIPALGAAWRLLAAQEPKRSQAQAQPEPRIAAEVPPGSAMQAGAALKELRDQRINEEWRRFGPGTR